jgi:hypothetical protein
MAGVATRTWAALLLLGIAAVTVSALAVAGVFSTSPSQGPTFHGTPIPEVIGMTTAKAVRTLKAVHLRPVVRFMHPKGQPRDVVVGAPSGWLPINAGGGKSTDVSSEDVVVLIVSR